MPIPAMTRETGSPEASPGLQAVPMVPGDARQEALRPRLTLCDSSLLLVMARPIVAFLPMMTLTLVFLPPPIALRARSPHRVAPQKA